MAGPAYTPSQTVGPFFSHALCERPLDRIVEPSHPAALRVYGAVLDGAREPVSDAMLELWQADPVGRFRHPDDPRPTPLPTPGFSGFARCTTNEAGRYEFVTVKPGRVPSPAGGLQAPHIAVSIFARGLLNRLVTRIYFPDEADANSEDPILAAIGDEHLRSTLVAQPRGDKLRFDIRLQGNDQTAFLAI